MKSSCELKVHIGSPEERSEEPLSPNAVILVRSFSAHILVTIGLNSPTNLDAFSAQLPLALNHPRFSSLMVEEGNGKLKWIQIPKVNIDDHIIVPSINPSLSKNRVAGDKFVEDYLNDLAKTSLDTSKPPWEFHLLDVKTSEAESIWILRIHHALGDGISITSHMLAWTRQISDQNSLPTIATMKKKKTTTKKIDEFRVWKLPKRLVLVVWWWLEVISNTIIDVSKLLATIFFFKDTNMFVMTSPETVTKGRRIVYKTLSLDDIKFIKNAMNVTINDVAIAIIEAGLSRYLHRRFGNDNMKESMKSKNNLEKLRMRICVAVSIRPLQGIQGLDDIKKKNTKLRMGNQVGFVFIPLSIRLRDDPKEYVRKAKAKIDRKKRSLDAKASIILMKCLAKLFGFKVVGLMTIKMASHVAIGVSNVPGPVEEISMFGHPVKFIAPTVHGLPTPILIHLQSCTNKMAVVLSVREDVVIDPHELLDDINGSLQLISAAVRKQNETPAMITHC